MDYNFLQKISREINKRYSCIDDISNLVADGKIKRFDLEKRGDTCLWIAAHEWTYKGNTYYSAVWGNWKDGSEYHVNSFSDNPKEAPKEVREQITKAKEENKKAVEDEKAKKNQSCREKWFPIYSRAKLEPHEYLQKKMIEPFLARVDEYGTLLVPIWSHDGSFEGVQRIFRDPVSGDMEKRYSSGIKIQGSFCPFGNIRNAEFVFVCEGFATAASVHMATGHAAIMAMSANNLLHAARALRAINPNCKIIFAADRDKNGTGEKYAKKACEALANAIYKMPTFSVQNEKWTDYNDLHVFEGIDRVRSQLQVDESDFIEIVPLGFYESKNYYFVSHKKQIIELGKSDHTAPTLLLNAPAKYWGNKYGFTFKANGEMSNQPDWKKVIEKMGLEIASQGVFDYSNIRGRGVWKEKAGLVVNLGDKIFHKGEIFPIFKNVLGSKYFYESGKAIKADLNKSLSYEEKQTIIKAFSMLNYKNKKDAIVLIGYIYSAQFFAALDWRPHVWITGPRGCGKSHILNYVHSALLFSKMVQDSSASGIRQTLMNDAFTIIYDESEPNTERDRAKMSDIISLARQCSTGKNYEVLRGSAGGKASSYNTNANFFLGSIQSSAMNGADISRFFVIEMNEIKKTEQSANDFKMLEYLMGQVSILSESLFSHAVNNYDDFSVNLEIAKSAIKSRQMESRLADQLSPIVAGYYAMFHDGVMTLEYANELLDYMNFEKSDYVKENATGDSEKCFDSILDIQVPSRGLTVGQAVNKAKYGENNLQKADGNDALAILGLNYEEDLDCLHISGNPILKRELERNQFSDFIRLIKRHPRILNNGESTNKLMNSKITQVVSVKLAY